MTIVVSAASSAISAHAQFLSDATGLVNRFGIPAGDQTFDVVITSNFDVTGYEFDAAERKLTLQTGASLSESIAEMVIPAGLLSGDFELHMDGEPLHDVSVQQNDKIALLVLNFDGGADVGNSGSGSGHLIEITGTESSVPAHVTVASFADNPSLSDLPVQTTPMPDDDLTSGTGTHGNGTAGGGGCLVATAAFGSELDHKVQHLREVRDTKIANTESGRAFLDTFNSVYYTLSPHIADYQRSNPAFNDAVRLLLSPMLSSLAIMNHAESGSDIHVIAYGLATIALNLGIYVAAPVVIISVSVSSARRILP